MARHMKPDSNSVSGDDKLAKAAHFAYHQATKDWVLIPSWDNENTLKAGWRAAAEAVRELVLKDDYRMITDHRFVGKCEWGIDPPDNAPCQYNEYGHPSGQCGMPKNQHVNLCPGALNIKGEHFQCDIVAPHDGWPHSNKQAQAVWQ